MTLHESNVKEKVPTSWIHSGLAHVANGNNEWREPAITLFGLISVGYHFELRSSIKKIRENIIFYPNR